MRTWPAPHPGTRPTLAWRSLVFVVLAALAAPLAPHASAQTLQEVLEAKEPKMNVPRVVLTEIATDTTYGFTAQNPIRVGSLPNERIFLDTLLGPRGERVSYTYLGTCCPYPAEDGFLGVRLLDIYEVSYPGIKQPVVLYFDRYQYDNPRCPWRFVLAPPVVLDEIHPVETETVQGMLPCNRDSVWAVNDPLLSVPNALRFNPRDTTPQFITLPVGLQRFFDERRLNNQSMRGRVYKVTIGFLVNCLGDVGNFRVLGVSTPELERLVNDLLLVFETSPHKWNPAKVNGRPVDAYQTLTFVVADGRLAQPTYR